jgi:hypothetical protein
MHYLPRTVPGRGLRWVLLSLAFALLGASACGVSVFGLEGQCPKEVGLSVSSGTQPTFSWNPNCDVVELQVYQGGEVVWSVHAFDGSFDSPVRYGDTPKGVTQQLGPEPLRADITYRVVIHEPGPGQSLRTIAAAEFTPE